MHTSANMIRPSFGILAAALFAALSITLCATPVRAQVGGIDSDRGDPGTGGKSSISGRVFLRGGGRLDRRAKVKLQGLNTGEQFQMSDDSGAFTFRRLRGGTYTVVVDAGEEFEPATETVDIIEPFRRRDEPGIVVPVTIYIEPKGSVKRTVGTVDASTGGVPDTAKTLYKQAIQSAQSGDTHQAIEQLKEALAIYPNFMTALNELGVQHMKLKEWRKAAESLRAAIKLGPEAFHPRLNYGIVLMQLKDFRAAAAELQIAVQKDSSSAVAYLQFGRALVSLGDYDGAQKALKQSIRIGGDDAIEAHRYLAAVHIETHYAQNAATELELYLALAPKAKDAERIRTLIKSLRSQASNRSQ